MAPQLTQFVPRGSGYGYSYTWTLQIPAVIVFEKLQATLEQAETLTPSHKLAETYSSS